MIKTELGPTPKSFQLHSTLLSRHSPWFANDFQASTSGSSPTWYSYTIEQVDSKVGLLRHHTSGERPNVSYGQPQTIDDIVIKVEDTSEEVCAASTKSTALTLPRKTSPSASAALKCYTQIFGTFYSIPPHISTNSIIAALVQTESLANTATELGCLHLLRPYTGNVFSQYRQALFLAIKADPARWIQLAISFENQSIYTECLVHLIGAYPGWSPAWPTKRTVLPEYLRNLIKRKSHEIDLERTEIERNILLTSIPYGRKGLPLDPTDRRQTETWLTVQAFRDQLAQRIDKLDRTRDALSRGTLFRGLFKGTLPCLQTEHVRKICKGIMHCDWQEIDDDLKSLRDHTGKLVADLAANELMIDPDANGVGYLTCAKIKNEDVPWLATSHSAG